MNIRFSINIYSDNEAFQECPIEEIQRIIRKYSNMISEGEISLMDINGNKVGEMELVIE